MLAFIISEIPSTVVDVSCIVFPKASLMRYGNKIVKNKPCQAFYLTLNK